MRDLSFRPNRTYQDCVEQATATQTVVLRMWREGRLDARAAEEANQQAWCITIKQGDCGKCSKCLLDGGWRIHTHPVVSRREWRRQAKAWRRSQLAKAAAYRGGRRD